MTPAWSPSCLLLIVAACFSNRSSGDLTIHDIMGATAAERIQEAKAAAKTNPAQAEAIYKEIISQGVGPTEAASRDYESALIALGELYRDQKRPHDLSELIKTIRSSFSSFAKAKSAKLGTQMLPPRGLMRQC